MGKRRAPTDDLSTSVFIPCCMGSVQSGPEGCTCEPTKAKEIATEIACECGRTVVCHVSIVYADPDCDVIAERDANARLIAAAPELLAAAKGVLDQFTAEHMDLMSASSCGTALVRAIAKAEGR